MLLLLLRVRWQPQTLCMYQVNCGSGGHYFQHGGMLLHSSDEVRLVTVIQLVYWCMMCWPCGTVPSCWYSVLGSLVQRHTMQTTARQQQQTDTHMEQRLTQPGQLADNWDRSWSDHCSCPTAYDPVPSGAQHEGRGAVWTQALSAVLYRRATHNEPGFLARHQRGTRGFQPACRPIRSCWM